MSSGRSFSLLVATVFAIIPPLLNGQILEERPYVLFENPHYPVNPGLPGHPHISGGAKAVAPAVAVTQVAAATLDMPATLASLAMPITPIALPEITAPPLSGSAGCTPLTQCRLYYQFVDVFYWPHDSHNTTCLLADQQINTARPKIPDAQSPSVYVVFPSIAAFDGCQQVGQTFADLTTSFAPEAMSTVRSDWSKYPFNFADLPCPPANVPWNRSEGPYQPLLAPPDFLFTIDPAFATCTPAASQGIDPYKPLKRAKKESPPNCEPPHCKRPLGR